MSVPVRSARASGFARTVRRCLTTAIPLIVTSIVTVFPAPVAAQSTATLVGTVVDTSGAAIPGATVEVASPALIERTKITVDALDIDYKALARRQQQAATLLRSAETRVTNPRGHRHPVPRRRPSVQPAGWRRLP